MLNSDVSRLAQSTPIAASADGKGLATQFWEGGADVWDLAAVAPVRRSLPLANGLCNLSLNPDGTTTVVIADGDPKLWASAGLGLLLVAAVMMGSPMAKHLVDAGFDQRTCAIVGGRSEGADDLRAATHTVSLRRELTGAALGARVVR